MGSHNYTIEQLKRAVELEAQERETNAAYNGAYHDGGASTLREQVKWYTRGERGLYPEEWEKYKKHIDPEYDEYLRLQEKFGRG